MARRPVAPDDPHDDDRPWLGFNVGASEARELIAGTVPERVRQTLAWMLDYEDAIGVAGTRRDSGATAVLAPTSQEPLLPLRKNPGDETDGVSDVSSRAEHELILKWRREASEGDTEEEYFKNECADQLAALITARTLKETA